MGKKAAAHNVQGATALLAAILNDSAAADGWGFLYHTSSFFTAGGRSLRSCQARAVAVVNGHDDLLISAIGRAAAARVYGAVKSIMVGKLEMVLSTTKMTRGSISTTMEFIGPHFDVTRR